MSGPLSQDERYVLRLKIAAEFMARTLTQPAVPDSSAAIDVRGWLKSELRVIARDALLAADVLLAESAE